MFLPELQACNYVENVLHYRCFSSDLARIYRTDFKELFRMYTNQKPVDYSPSGVFNPLMPLLAKGHTYLNKPASL